METKPDMERIDLSAANQMFREAMKAYMDEIIERGRKVGTRLEGMASNAMKDVADIDDVMERFSKYVDCRSQRNTRTITVSYDPDGDVDSLDYVKVTVYPTDDELGGQDNVALLLAAAKILAKTCPGVDEVAYGGMLLEGTEDWLKSVVLDALIGGYLDGKS